MKKSIFAVLFIFAVVSVYSQTGVIREFTGDVELKPAGAANFTPARQGSTVAQDTVISTGFRSTAIIVIGSAEITIRPLTRLTLAEIQSASETETLNVNLQTGRVRVAVNPPAGTRANTTVQTPSATASVRGTSFSVGVDNIDGHSGKTNYKSNSTGLSTSITSGFKSESNTTGGVTNPNDMLTKSLLPGQPGTGDSSDLESSLEIVMGGLVVSVEN